MEMICTDQTKSGSRRSYRWPAAAGAVTSLRSIFWMLSISLFLNPWLSSSGRSTLVEALRDPKGLSLRDDLLNTFANPPTWHPPVVKMNYQGGRVMSKPIKIYLIWYGEWDDYAKGLTRAAIESLTPDGSSEYSPNLNDWWKIATQYQQWPPWGARVSSNVSINGEYNNSYSHGKSLDLRPGLDLLKDIVASSIRPVEIDSSSSSSSATTTEEGIFEGNSTAPFEYDEAGIYMLMLGFDVEVKAAQRFKFCAFHSFLCLRGGNDSANETDCKLDSSNKVVYTFTPFYSKTNFFDNCILFKEGEALWPPPNGGNGALDSMITAVLHEIVEAATDPYGNAWKFNRTENSEVADMCSYVFGPGGYYYCDLEDPYGDFYANDKQCNGYGEPLVDPKSKVMFNIYGDQGTKFLIQYIWSLESGGCQLQYEDACNNGIREEQKKSQGGVVSVGYFANNGGTMVGMQRYAAGLNCSWLVNVTEAKQLSFTFSAVSTDYESDFLEVYDATGKKLQLAIAGTVPSPEPRNVPGPAAVIQFSSDGSRSPAPGFTGWQVTYTPGYCVGVTLLTGITGSFTDGTPNGLNYARGLNCSWIIKANASRNDTTSLIFTRLDMAPEDYLAIYDGESAVVTSQLRQVSGPQEGETLFLPPPTTTDGSMLVVFITKTSQGRGWSATYGPTGSMHISPSPTSPSSLHVGSSTTPSVSFSFRLLAACTLLQLLLIVRN